MDNDKKMRGVNPAMLTPLDKNQEVNYKAVRKLCAFLVDKGVHGLFVCGSTGEGPLLSIEERKKVAETVIDEVGDKTRVVMHVGAITAQDTLELARHSVSLGVSGIGVVTPFYYKCSQEALYDYYGQIAGAVEDTYIYIYNIPQLTGNDLGFETLERLAKDFPNIVGIKDSSGSFQKLLDYLRVEKEDFRVISGADTLFLSNLAHGGAGAVTGVGSAFPEPYVALYERFQAGDYKGALAYQQKIFELEEVVKGDLPLLKRALYWRGIEGGTSRSPLRNLTDGERGKFDKEGRKRLEELGFAI